MESTFHIHVQEGDIDHLGHVNYVRYIHYFEQGMGDWFKKCRRSTSEWKEKHLGTVVVNFDINYIKESRLGETLKVMTVPVRLGTKSFTVQQKIYNAKEELITECNKTFVMFNTSIRKGIPVVEEIARNFSK